MRLAWVLVLLVAATVTGCLGPGCSGGGDVLVTDGADGPPVPGATLAGESRNTTTDAEGRAEAPGSHFTIVKDGFVPEEVCLTGGSEPHVVGIYRMHLDLSMAGQLVGGDVGTNDGPDAVPDRWDAQEVPFPGTPRSREGYAQRLYGLNATLRWNNTLLSGAGDLALGIGATADEALLWHDGDDPQVTPGEQTEVLRVTLRDFDSRWQGARTLYAGAGAGKAYASATGIAYTLKLEAYFGQPHGSPAPSSLLLVGSVVALALMLRRRSRRA